jgi:hypothetical protein
VAITDFDPDYGFVPPWAFRWRECFGNYNEELARQRFRFIPLLEEGGDLSPCVAFAEASWTGRTLQP